MSKRRRMSREERERIETEIAVETCSDDPVPVLYELYRSTRGTDRFLIHRILSEGKDLAREIIKELDNLADKITEEIRKFAEKHDIITKLAIFGKLEYSLSEYNKVIEEIRTALDRRGRDFFIKPSTEEGWLHLWNRRRDYPTDEYRFAEIHLKPEENKFTILYEGLIDAIPDIRCEAKEKCYDFWAYRVVNNPRALLEFLRRANPRNIFTCTTYQMVLEYRRTLRGLAELLEEELRWH